MAIKTFNVSPEVYGKFSKFCRDHGVSMSRQVELFMRTQIEDDPKAKKEYLARLERIRKGRFIQVSDFAKEFGI